MVQARLQLATLLLDWYDYFLLQWIVTIEINGNSLF